MIEGCYGHPLHCAHTQAQFANSLWYPDKSVLAEFSVNPPSSVTVGSERTREAVLTAATKLLANGALSFSQVSRDVGMSRQRVHSCFPGGQKALIAEVEAWAFAELRSLLIFAGRADQPAGYFIRFFQSVGDLPREKAIALTALLNANHPKSDAARRRIAKAINRWRSQSEIDQARVPWLVRYLILMAQLIAADNPNLGGDRNKGAVSPAKALQLFQFGIPYVVTFETAPDPPETTV